MPYFAAIHLESKLTWISARSVQLRIVQSVMECSPVVLIGTVSITRPVQQVLSTLVINNKLHKLAAKYPVRTAADNVNAVRWLRVPLRQ